MEKIEEIFTDQIDDPMFAMRSELDREALFVLSDNIKQNGLINPITVRPIGSRFEVVAGHRRLSACKIAGIIKISCVVRELDDQKTFEVMAAENLERADVDPVDEANFISKFIQKTGKTIPEVAHAIKRSVGYVESRLAIGSMPDYMQDYLKIGKMKLGVALALVQISDDRIRRVWVEMAVRDGVSVPQAEHWLHGWEMNRLPGGIFSDVPPTDFQNNVSPIVMFECAIDGKKYDARLFQSVLIYEGNLPFFNAVVKEFRSPPSEILP
jgi:ParB-like partition proteins